MANPQLEDGYLKIANVLMDALIRIRIPGEARQVFDFILRKTYGFNKKTDAIPLSQFNKATGIKKPHIIRALSTLLRMNLITKNGNGKSITYSINKDFDSWKPLPKKVIITQNGNNEHNTTPNITQNGNNVAQKGNKSLPKMVPSKDNTKDTIQKTSESPNFENSDIVHLENAALLETPPLELDKLRGN